MSGKSSKKQKSERQRFDRVLPLLALLFMIDMVAVFKGYWWRDTLSSVYWSLGCITLINMIFPNRHFSHRIPTDLLLGIYITFRITWHRQPELVEHYSERLVVVYPFLEIVLAVILIYMLLERYAVTKRRLMIAFAVGLLILTIRDSFSELRLWLNIAFLVVLLLVWHTLLHYRSMDGATLSKLLKRPLALFTPVVAVILAITIVGFSLPHGPPLLEDPYALWKKSRGEKVQSFIGDKGYSTYTGLKLLTTSGYSRDSSQLGGGFNYDYTPVMRVDTTQKGYLRGETRATYDGNGWSNQEDLITQETVTVGEWLPLSDGGQAQYVDVEQQITLLDDRSSSVLFANGIPLKLQNVEYQFNDQPLRTFSEGMDLPDFIFELPSHSLVASVKNAPVSSYSIYSQALIISNEGLKKTSASFTDSQLKQPAYHQYVAVPDVVPARVHELAATVTEAGSNDYERALLLELYLRMNYRYTNTPDLSLLSGQSDDFVDQFLFELQEGYCDYFSTAMVIMARTLGMPARWVKGFTTGVNEQEQMMLSSMPQMEEEYVPSSSGIFTVRNADAHSWVEIYFEGYGWVPFEPTPGFSIPQQYGQEEVEDVLQDIMPTIPPVTATTDIEKEASSWLTAGQKQLIVWISSLLLLALVASLLLYHRKSLATHWLKLRYITYSNNQRIIEEAAHLLKQGKRKGLPVRDNLTMRETLLEWKRYYPNAVESLDILLHTFEMASYSNSEISHEQVEKTRQAVEHIKQQWKKK